MFNLKLVREDLSNEEEVKQLSLSCVFISKEFKLSKVLIEDGLRDALKKSIIERFFFLTNDKNVSEYDPIVSVEDSIDSINVKEVSKLEEIKNSFSDISHIPLINTFEEIKDSRAYAIVLTNIDNKKIYVFFKKVFSSLYLKSKLKALFAEGRLKKFKENIISIDERFDCVMYDNYMAIFTQLYFEQIFEYQDEYTKKCNENINKIKQLNIIENLDKIEKDSEKVTIKKKLAKIKDSDINWFNDKMNKSIKDIENIITKVGLDMKIENGKIVPNDTSELIHLIQDDYLKSDLSGDDYVTDRKIKILKKADAKKYKIKEHN
ncbi:Kiwa anti-phage protein KwaB-like domain-containing protein [uncultured Clostridium sp.]|uniref:Kiwa anti-phage protein KwaB-like domain-containing protein n=1 Tax=uncultured Clostridium sp. TaxID=59620 RepID=UPI00280A9C53|nr:Kiwa anti-phage protein KwaB-like domain-containing protein [uncultured Clostridium sp.]